MITVNQGDRQSVFELLTNNFGKWSSLFARGAVRTKNSWQ